MSQTSIDNLKVTTEAATTVNSTTVNATTVNVTGSVNATTAAEIGYVSGVTSAIQTQLNSKETILDGAASTVSHTNLTVSSAVVSDASGKIAVSPTTSAEIGYVHGVTSAIQTQLNGKQATLGYTAENTANKATDLTTPDNTKYPTTAAVATALAAKQGTGNYVTSLTGDVTGAGPGATATTLATVNSNVGSFGSASSVMTQTVNAKGLTTAAASVPIQITESQVTNLTTDLAGKQATGNYVTALTGDVTAAGPGAVAATLATVNANVGTFGTASSVPAVTVNAKGLVTGAVNTAIQITESQVTNLTTDLANKQATGNYITSITGDATAAGPGAAAITLATVSTTPGSFGSASAVPAVTVNAKGLTTATTSVPIQIAESQVTGLVSDLAGKQPTITGGATTITTSNLTANKALASDVNGKVTVSTTTDAELNFVSGVTSAIQTQLNAKQATITGAASTVVSANLTASVAVVTDATGKLAPATTTATEIGYVSGVTSAIQTQINTKVPTTRQVIAGTGLSGGGALSADVTVSLPNVGTAATYGTASNVSTITTDAQGRVSGAVNTPISITSSAITNFAATVLSTVLTGLSVATSSPVLATDAILGAFGKLQAQINTLLARNVIAGTGLSGGGTLASDVTISMPNVGTAGSKGSASSVPVFTTDAQGRVTADTDTAIAITASQVTNFNAAAIAAPLTGLTFTNATPAATDSIVTAIGKIEGQFQAAAATSITAGAGLTGGGAFGTNVTIAMPNTGTAGTFGGVNAIPVITTDAQGRVTSISTVTPADATFGEIVSTTVATTTSTTDAVINAMTVTLAAAGTYACSFTSSFTANAAGQAISYSFYVGGTQKASTLQKVAPLDGGVGSNATARGAASLYSLITVTAGQAVDVRWSTSSGTATSGPTILTYQRIA